MTVVARRCRHPDVRKTVTLAFDVAQRIEDFRKTLHDPTGTVEEALELCVVAGLMAFESGQSVAEGCSSVVPSVPVVAKKAKAKTAKVPKQVTKQISPPPVAKKRGRPPKSKLSKPAAVRALLAAHPTPQEMRMQELVYERCPPEEPACSLGVMGGVCSVPAPLWIANPDGPPTAQVARFCVVDANDLVPSHSPVNNWLPNPKYPKDVQERRYDKDKAEQLKVIQIAQQLAPPVVFNRSPDAINGPPVITESGLVLGGNGRSMALQLHYAQGGEAEAKRYLVEHAQDFGFQPDEIKKIKRPALVRVVKIPDEKQQTLSRLVRRYNVAMTQGMDVRAAAAAEARQLSQEALDIFATTIPDDETLNAYLNSRASVPFVDELRRSGVITQRNASQYLNKAGTLNDAGRELVENILTATVITDTNLLDEMGPQLRNAIARIVPYVLIAASAEPQWDVRDALQAAARDVVRMKTQNHVNVEEYLNQSGLFSDIKPAVEGIPLAVPTLHLLWSLSDKPVKLARVFRRYADQSRRSPRGQAGFQFESGKAAEPSELLTAV